MSIGPSKFYPKGGLILCLVLLQVPKHFGLVHIFCVGPKIYLQIVPVTNILCQTKRWFAFSRIGFCASTKVFEEALCKCSHIFVLAQNIWTSTKHFGTCKRTRHKSQKWQGFAQKWGLCMPIWHLLKCTSQMMVELKKMNATIF